MALNYVDGRLANIICDKVCSDSFDVSNLLVQNDDKKSSQEDSFMVESFISPPVSIRVEMTQHPIDIYAIDIGLQVRTHKTSSIIISTSQSLDGKTRSEEIVKLFNVQENSIVATNSNYSQCYALRLCGFRTDHILAKTSNSTSKHFIIGRRFAKAMTNVQSVTIRIVATALRTVPCLSHLRIYGKPTRLDHNAVMNFCRNYFPDKIVQTPSQSSTSSSGDERHSRDKRNLQSDKIDNKKQIKRSRKDLERIAPIEFMDSLTEELMNDPYELPSGKNIDKLSLNKYLDSFNDPKDACDPFTRIPFDSKNFPKPNETLKLRIQKFHSTNGESELELEKERRKKLLGI